MKISRLHYITANPAHAEKACTGGVDWIQLRVKNKSEEEWKAIAQEAKRICKMHNAKLIINDSVKLAKIIGADGLHLGKEDMPADEARKLLGPDFIIGGTANTFEDIQRLAALKVDYIGLGPFRFTQTKKNLSPLLGLHGYKELIKQCAIENITVPVIAIGGIQLNDVNNIMETGVHGIAVSSAISEPGDIALAATAFIEKIKMSSYEKQPTENR
jgi:thiamine-phosphate pyrophosphorylase